MTLSRPRGEAKSYIPGEGRYQHSCEQRREKVDESCFELSFLAATVF